MATWTVLEREGYDYVGPVELACGGPSSQQQQIAGQQQQFYQTLQNSYNQTFAGQQSILNSLTSSFSPILKAGINQYGFSPQEDAALRTQATTGVAGQYQAANKATQEQLAATGGGNQFLPTGAQSQLTQQNAQAAAQQQSSEQLGITEAGYQQGRADYLAATQGLGGVANTLNPNSYALNANTGGSAAYSSAQQNATQSAQMWEAIGSTVGGLASTALGAYMGGKAPGGGGGGGGSNAMGGDYMWA
jgi:hypothetical protein